MQFPGTIIRVALLGADENSLEIVQAIQQSDPFRLVGLCDFEPGVEEADQLLKSGLLAGARRFESWEALLDAQTTDAVVVARGCDEDRRAEQLRKLIQVGMPILVSHPVVDSMLIYYELDMIRRETQCVVLPYLPARQHPALGALRGWAAAGTESPIGKLEQVIIERAVAQPTRTRVFRQFARDVDLIRFLAGDMTRLGAMAADGAGSGHGSLGVQMSGPRGVVGRWSVDPLESAQGGRISVLGSRGKAIISMTTAGAWETELMAASQTDVQLFDEWSPGAAALAQLQAALDGRTSEPDWVDAARGVELAETIDRSLQKSRTIDLYYEDYTEEATFKGMMTSLGCGLLLVGLFLLGAVAIAEQLGVPYVKLWPYLLLVAMGVFLLLQFLLLASRKERREQRAEAGAPPSGVAGHQDS